jgi:hypothetical protein
MDFTPQDVAIFQRSFERAVLVMRKFLVSLSPREKLILQLGLRASHLEEALAAGDQQRAAAHAQGLVTIAQALAASQKPSDSV